MQSRAYEFSFGEMTIGDYHFMVAYSIRATNNVNDSTDLLNALTISQRYTNTIIVDLPLLELRNYLEQFIIALTEHLRDIEYNADNSNT